MKRLAPFLFMILLAVSGCGDDIPSLPSTGDSDTELDAGWSPDASPDLDTGDTTSDTGDAADHLDAGGSGDTDDNLDADSDGDTGHEDAGDTGHEDAGDTGGSSQPCGLGHPVHDDHPGDADGICKNNPDHPLFQKD